MQKRLIKCNEGGMSKSYTLRTLSADFKHVTTLTLIENETLRNGFLVHNTPVQLQVETEKYPIQFGRQPGGMMMLSMVRATPKIINFVMDVVRQHGEVLDHKRMETYMRNYLAFKYS